ncbi:hypothetical protein EQG41_15625 [Billgrantia azerbaijanica]|nr:hypothetical protein EQG41_15625 [Halomonas azerbaijanica]
MMKTLLIAGTLALLAAAMGSPALADHIRHRDSYLIQGTPHFEQGDRWLSSGKYHHFKHRDKAFRKHHHKAFKHRHHRAGPSRRLVERHDYIYIERPYRHGVRRHHHRRHHSDIPLVTVDGFPLLRIQINH